MNKEAHILNYGWLAVSCGFDPYSFTGAAGEGRLGCQRLKAAAVTEDSMRGLDRIPPLPLDPGFIGADKLIFFIDSVFALHGRPSIGVMVMAEVWMGTSDLLLMPALAERTRFLADTGESWPEIPSEQRALLHNHLRRLDLDLEWASSERPILN